MKRVNVKTVRRAVARATSKPSRPLTDKQRSALRSALRALGSMGGKASAEALTPTQRTERARKAGKARQAQAQAKGKARKDSSR